ncbi:hypothetical protein HGRIS_004865 [Hohenbuehelia grisea]|uniref:C2H2-type domain-containing protein n=1 Tax=Hohenbuehelia grisea TaxID=104357 RepID=A0ABR3JEJ0_9AGAR
MLRCSLDPSLLPPSSRPQLLLQSNRHPPPQKKEMCNYNSKREATLAPRPSRGATQSFNLRVAQWDIPTLSTPNDDARHHPGTTADDLDAAALLIALNRSHRGVSTMNPAQWDKSSGDSMSTLINASRTVERLAEELSSCSVTVQPFSPAPSSVNGTPPPVPWSFNDHYNNYKGLMPTTPSRESTPTMVEDTPSPMDWSSDESRSPSPELEYFVEKEVTESVALRRSPRAAKMPKSLDTQNMKKMPARLVCKKSRLGIDEGTVVAESRPRKSKSSRAVKAELLGTKPAPQKPVRSVNWQPRKDTVMHDLMTKKKWKITADGRFECQECFRSLKGDFARHWRIHDPHAEVFKCPACPEFGTLQWTNLRTHCRSQHGYERDVICGECGKRFADPSVRLRHMKKDHDYVPAKRDKATKYSYADSDY